MLAEGPRHRPNGGEGTPASTSASWSAAHRDRVRDRLPRSPGRRSSAGLGPDRLTGATSNSLYVQSMDRRVRAFAPGRVNLIGEHTDYNDGLCLPFAIAHGVTVSVAPLRGREIEVRALDLGESDRFAPAACGAGAGRRAGHRPPPGDWRSFVRGGGAAAPVGHRGAPCGSRSAVTCRTPPAWRPRRHSSRCPWRCARRCSAAMRRARWSSRSCAPRWRTNGSAPRPGCSTSSPRSVAGRGARFGSIFVT